MREAVESDSRQYYDEKYPDIQYGGMTGFFPDTETGGFNIAPQVNRSVYWPVHYLEPVLGNEGAIDLDVYSSPVRRETIEKATSTWAPVLSDRLRIVQETDSDAFSVILFHPGNPRLQSPEKPLSTEIVSIVIRMPDLLSHSVEPIHHSSLNAFLFDTGDTLQQPIF